MAYTLSGGTRDQDTSQAAAQAMVDGFGINNLKVPPALHSNHTLGLAIDMAITWVGRLTVIDARGVKQTIRGGPRDRPKQKVNSHRGQLSASSTLCGMSYKDRNHWSVNGH